MINGYWNTNCREVERKWGQNWQKSWYEKYFVISWPQMRRLLLKMRRKNIKEFPFHLCWRICSFVECCCVYALAALHIRMAAAWKILLLSRCETIMEQEQVLKSTLSAVSEQFSVSRIRQQRNCRCRFRCLESFVPSCGEMTKKKKWCVQERIQIVQFILSFDSELMPILNINSIMQSFIAIYLNGNTANSIIAIGDISRDNSTELKRYTYGSGVWYGELTWRTYCVLWKIRNASDAKKSRAVKRPAAGRNVNPVLLRKKLLISSNCGMRDSQKMPSFWSLAKTLRYSRQACFGIKSRTVRNTEPQVWFSTSVYSINGTASPLLN